MALLSTIISFVTCSLRSLYRKYWIFRTYHFTCSLIPHINVSLKYLSYGIDDLYIVSAFLRCHHFRGDPKCSMTGIIYLLRSQPKDKAINEQLGAWSFADTFCTAEKTNLISLWSEDSLNASLWRQIRPFRISRIVTDIIWVCNVFTTRTKEDL